MSVKSGFLLGAFVFGAVALGLLAAGPGAAAPGELRYVHVTNFPDAFRVAGAVQVDQTGFVRVRNVAVTPVTPQETTRLISGGVIETEGYPGLVLSLAVEAKGEIQKAGRVGAILLPDDDAVVQVFNEQGQMLFPLEVSLDIPVGGAVHLASKQPHFAVGFPRYRVLFYNTTNRAVAVNFYAYLTN